MRPLLSAQYPTDTINGHESFILVLDLSNPFDWQLSVANTFVLTFPPDIRKKVKFLPPTL
jgi:hypothetical protein